MAITLSHSLAILKGEIHLTASKSESNRALIIQALCAEEFDIDNLSISNDTVVLKELLSSQSDELSVNLAGTAMRFLTAYLAIQNKEVLLTGAQRMKERPIKVLVDVLREMGAEISYEEKEGYPPLKIKGKKLFGEKVSIDGGISSQYISALLMIATKLEDGLIISFEGEIISKPYINMTIEMMRYFGAEVQWENNSIVVVAGNYKAIDFKVEADWSAASYWYSMVALAKEADITLYGLKQESLQGDSVVQEIYKTFGVATEFIKGGIRLTKSPIINYQSSIINFKDCPDIAQTVAVTCAALNIPAKLTGLKTLRIKETDRIAALQTELTKLGFLVDVEGDDFLINRLSHTCGNLSDDAQESIHTYDDHRMAMAFAPLALQNPINIEDENVVAKSYPNFWKDLQHVGFKMV
jgi:3-phosphoshikimate 1-carboxyvinyltransferase